MAYVSRNSDSVKTVSSSYDSNTATSLLSQPSLYASLAALMALYYSQSAPQDALPLSLVGRRIQGVSTHRMLVIPFSTISIAYLAIADGVNSGRLMGSHFAGFTMSSVLAVSFMSLYRISYFWPILGIGYGTYGVMHHLRQLNMFYDGVPLVSLNDIKEVGLDFFWYRQRRAMRLAAAEEVRRLQVSELAAHAQHEAVVTTQGNDNRGY